MSGAYCILRARFHRCPFLPAMAAGLRHHRVFSAAAGHHRARADAAVHHSSAFGCYNRAGAGVGKAPAVISSLSLSCEASLLSHRWWLSCGWGRSDPPHASGLPPRSLWWGSVGLHWRATSALYSAYQPNPMSHMPHLQSRAAGSFCCAAVNTASLLCSSSEGSDGRYTVEQVQRLYGNDVFLLTEAHMRIYAYGYA